jgi:hypothetical protein
MTIVYVNSRNETNKALWPHRDTVSTMMDSPELTAASGHDGRDLKPSSGSILHFQARSMLAAGLKYKHFQHLAADYVSPKLHSFERAIATRQSVG